MGVAVLSGSDGRRAYARTQTLAWTVTASAVLAVMAVSGRGERAAGLLLLGAVAVRSELDEELARGDDADRRSLAGILCRASAAANRSGVLYR